ncbi:unnamed protein product [Chilo suppressalis]|uniref:Uncharacterized protein n=1 Tax=Chilo suppressalis TaxID=168631 RepID=A0ABN8L9J9_CHISP|nr:unnamed protein product [Chilo suppressalis]
MQPTAHVAAWSAYAGWPAVPRDLLETRRLRLALLEPPRRDALYTPDQIRHLIRLETVGRWPGTAPPALWRPDARAFDLDTRWRLPDIIQNVRLERGGGGVAVDSGSGSGGGLPVGLGAGAARGWEGAARGWAAGAVLLAVLLLLVRALERCLHRRATHTGRRRSSEEWPTPNVMATSCQYGGPHPRLDDSDTYQSDNRDTSSNDLPPPYSECANDELPSPDPNKIIGMEEPPPPYSACYFTNPKDGIPTVHFYNRRNDLNTIAEIGHSSTDLAVAPNLSIIGNDEEDKISNCDVEDNRDVRNANRGFEDDRRINYNANADTNEEVARHRGNDHIVDIRELETQERNPRV